MKDTGLRLDPGAAGAGGRDLHPASPKVYVVPSLDLVVTRLGDRGSIDGSSFNDAFWDRLIEAAPPHPDLE